MRQSHQLLHLRRLVQTVRRVQRVQMRRCSQLLHLRRLVQMVPMVQTVH